MLRFVPEALSDDLLVSGSQTEASVRFRLKLPQTIWEFPKLGVP